MRAFTPKVGHTCTYWRAGMKPVEARITAVSGGAGTWSLSLLTNPGTIVTAVLQQSTRTQTGVFSNVRHP